MRNQLIRQKDFTVQIILVCNPPKMYLNYESIIIMNQT